MSTKKEAREWTVKGGIDIFDNVRILADGPVPAVNENIKVVEISALEQERAKSRKLAEALKQIENMQSKGYNDGGLQWHQVRARKSLAEYEEDE